MQSKGKKKYAVFNNKEKLYLTDKWARDHYPWAEERPYLFHSRESAMDAVRRIMSSNQIEMFERTFRNRHKISLLYSLSVVEFEVKRNLCPAIEVHGEI